MSDQEQEVPSTTRRLVFTQAAEVIGEDDGIRQAPDTQAPGVNEVAAMSAKPTETTSIDEMSVEELRRHQEEIDKKIQEKREAEKKAVIDQIVNVVNTYNIPIEELVDALGGLKIKRKGVPAVQKYQDPVTGATWSGRGKEPIWIRGKKREQFLIP